MGYKMCYSFRSCGNNKLFSVMFKDSEITSSMAVCRTKCSYLVNSSLPPYF